MSAASDTRKECEVVNIFQWRIKNLSSFLKSSRDARTKISPTFVGKSTNLPNSYWKIIIHIPEGLAEHRIDAVPVYLHLKKGHPAMKVRAQLSVLLSDQKEVFSSKLWEGTFEGRDSLPGELEVFNIASCSNISNVPYLLSTFGKGLRLKVKVWITDVLNGDVSPAKDPQPQKGHNNFLQLLNSPEFSDVSITAEEMTFKAHKNILAFRSPVFAAMFQSPMSESLSNTVNIEQFSSRTVKGMLEFIYGGSLEAVKDDFIELLKIADFYQLDELKTDCINTAVMKISAENVFELLYLAELYKAPELKSNALKFINSKKGVSLLSPTHENADLNQIAKDQPNLLLEMFQDLRHNYAHGNSLEESEDDIIEATFTKTYTTTFTT